MSVPFARTLRSVERGQGLQPLGTVAALVLAGTWLLWAMLAPVTVYEQGAEAQLVAAGGARGLAAEVGGRVVEVVVAPGDGVAA